jgi:cytochrome b
MNIESACHAERSGRILVWDLPVRVFHWLMVLCFAGAYLTAESERWRLVHVTLGYTMAGLVAFRIVWGLLGTRHARFANFVKGPAAVLLYLKSLRGAHERHVGHNPAGGLAILALLAFAVMVVATGWAAYHDIGGGEIEDLHEVLANLMLGIVAVHVVGVLTASWLQRENLIGAMVTGCKQGEPADGIGRAWRLLAAAMLASVLGFWWLQWHDAPPAATPQTAKHSHDDDD